MLFVSPQYHDCVTYTQEVRERSQGCYHQTITSCGLAGAVMVPIKTVPGLKSGIQGKIVTVCRVQGRQKAFAGIQQRLHLTSTKWPLSGCGRSSWFFGVAVGGISTCQLQNCKVSGPLTQGVKHLVLMSLKSMFPRRKK